MALRCQMLSSHACDLSAKSLGMLKDDVNSATFGSFGAFWVPVYFGHPRKGTRSGRKLSTLITPSFIKFGAHMMIRDVWHALGSVAHVFNTNDRWFFIAWCNSWTLHVATIFWILISVHRWVVLIDINRMLQDFNPVKVVPRTGFWNSRPKHRWTCCTLEHWHWPR